ncbi:CCP110 family protein [Megaselia abdita]
MAAFTYKSLFKIQGKSILPPLMTVEKRIEISKYRQQAIIIENKMNEQKTAKLRTEKNIINKCSSLQRSPNQALNFQCSEADSESTVDNEYLRVSNMYRKPFVKKDRNMQLNLSPAVNLQKSDTFIYDVTSNTLTNSFNDEDDIKQSTSSSSIVSMISNITSTQNSNNISIPTIHINPPTPIVLNKDLNENSTETKNYVESPLIRSNSFTLDSPSTVLLQHINRQQSAQRRKSTATNDTIESKAKKVTKSPLVVSASIGNISSIRSKRSPYDSRSIKVNRKKVVSLTKTRSSCRSGSLSLDPLKHVEESHRQRFVELLKKQKEAQTKLQKNFEIQQQLLMDELTKGMFVNKLQATKSPVSDVESSPTFRKSYSDSSELEKKTPRRKLFASKSPDNTVEYNAATKINAYVRGYLTRRLFDTCFVQEICKNVKQYLQYLYQIHNEFSDNDTAETTTVKIILLKRVSMLFILYEN